MQWPDLVPARSDFEGTGTDRRVRPTVLRSLVTAVAQAPELWAPHVRFDLAERYFTRLHLDRDFEVWLICWETGQDTLLHDHGGSVGAFTVARGSLVEDYSDRRGDGEHRGEAGCGSIVGGLRQAGSQDRRKPLQELRCGTRGYRVRQPLGRGGERAACDCASDVGEDLVE